MTAPKLSQYVDLLKKPNKMRAKGPRTGHDDEYLEAGRQTEAGSHDAERMLEARRNSRKTSGDLLQSLNDLPVLAPLDTFMKENNKQLHNKAVMRGPRHRSSDEEHRSLVTIPRPASTTNTRTCEHNAVAICPRCTRGPTDPLSNFDQDREEDILEPLRPSTSDASSSTASDETQVTVGSSVSSQQSRKVQLNEEASGVSASMQAHDPAPGPSDGVPSGTSQDSALRDTAQLSDVCYSMLPVTPAVTGSAGSGPASVYTLLEIPLPSMKHPVKRTLAPRPSTHDVYFSQAPPSGGNAKTESALSKLFDKYRDDPRNSPDTIQMAGAAPYFGDLGINMEDPDISLLVITELLQCPSLGDIPRANFINAWSPVNATTVAPQQSHLRLLVQRLQAPEERHQNGLYRRVYKHTFRIACPPGSKSVPLDQALEFWRHLFGPKGFVWTSDDGTNWFNEYTTFLNEKWKKAVNRDLWDQTLLFAMKTVEDPTLGWWNEIDSAWPGVIDEFIGGMKEKRNAGDAMDES